MSQESYLYYLEKAIANFKNKDYDTALSLLDEALQDNYDVPQLHYWIGKIYAEELTEERLKTAIISFSEAIDLKNDYTEAYFERGKVYLKLGEVEKAINDFQKVLQLEPNKKEVYTYLAQAYLNKGEKEKALSILKKIANEESLEFYLYIGKILLETGSFKEAIENLEKAKSLDKNNPQIYELLARGYMGTGEYLKAVENFEKAAYLNPSEDIYFKQIAVCFLKEAEKEAEKGNIKRAGKLISMAINVDYDAPITDFHRSVLKEAINSCLLEGKNKEALSFIDCIEQMAKLDEELMELKKKAFKGLSVKDKLIRLITDIYTK